MSNLVLYEERPEDDEHEQLGRPFRIKARLYNNRLVRARLEMGFESVAAMAAAFKMSVTTVREYEKLSKSPWNEKKCEWRPSAIALSEVLGYSPEELWPEAIFAARQRYMEVEAGSASIALADPNDPSDSIDQRKLSAAVRRELHKLAPREEKVLRARFGIDQDEKSFEQVADDLEVSRTRVDQIAAKALRKLKAWSRSLVVFYDPPARSLYEMWMDEMERVWEEIGGAMAGTTVMGRARAEEAKQRLPECDDVAVWCKHLDKEVASKVTPDAPHWTELPRTAHFFLKGKKVVLHWYLECEACWEQRVLNRAALSSKMRGGKTLAAAYFKPKARTEDSCV